jgi:DNA polymerase-3 subunit gamma/tau
MLSPNNLKLPPELTSKYTASALVYTQQQCLAALDLCLKTESHFSKALTPRTSLELLLLQILRTKNRIPIEALIRRLSELEESVMRVPQTPMLSVPPVLETLPAQPVIEKPPVAVARPAEPTPEQTAAPIRTEPPVTEAMVVAMAVKPVSEKPPVAATKPEKPTSAQTAAPIPPVRNEEKMSPTKPQSHYDTLIRFAAIELEGTVLKT